MKKLIKKVSQQPFEYEVEGSRIAIVFIHGFLEGPAQFQSLAKRAATHQISSFGLLLPGHGGSLKQFASSHQKQWLTYVDEAIQTVSKNYEQIILVGHSMGTLLSLLLCEKYACIVGVFAIATPLSIQLNKRGVSCALKVVTNSVSPDDVYALASYQAWSIERGRWLTYLAWIPRYFDLFYLIVKTKQILPTIKKPIQFVHCQKDEFVRQKTTKLMKQKLTTTTWQLLELPQSGHFYYIETESQQLEQAFETFLKSYQLKTNEKMERI